MKSEPVAGNAGRGLQALRRWSTPVANTAGYLKKIRSEAKPIAASPGRRTGRRMRSAWLLRLPCTRGITVMSQPTSPDDAYGAFAVLCTSALDCRGKGVSQCLSTLIYGLEQSALSAVDYSMRMAELPLGFGSLLPVVGRCDLVSCRRLPVAARAGKSHEAMLAQHKAAAGTEEIQPREFAATFRDDIDALEGAS